MESEVKFCMNLGLGLGGFGLGLGSGFRFGFRFRFGLELGLRVELGTRFILYRIERVGLSVRVPVMLSLDIEDTRI